MVAVAIVAIVAVLSGTGLIVREVLDERPLGERFRVAVGTSVSDIAFAASTQALVVRASTDAIHVFSLVDGRPLGKFDAAGLHLAVSPDGTRVAAGRSIHALPGGGVLLDLGAGADAQGFSPDGTRVVVLRSTGEGSRASIVSAETGALACDLAPHDIDSGTGLVLGSGTVVGIAPEGEAILVWSASDGRLLATPPLGRAIVPVSGLTAPGEIAVMSAEPQVPIAPRLVVHVLDAASGAHVRMLEIFASALSSTESLSLSLGGGLAAVGSPRSRIVRLYSLADGAKRGEIAHTGDLVRARISPDGRFLAVSVEDRVSVWAIR
jgi:hypothetical protein